MLILLQVVGALSLGCGILAVFLLPSGPHNAFFLNKEEKAVAVWRIAGNRTGVQHSKLLAYQVREAFLEPRVWLLAVQQLSLGIVNGGVTNFFSALLSGFGWPSQKAVLYQLPGGAFQLVVTIIAGIISSKVPNSTIITIMVVQLPVIAATAGLVTIDSEHQMALTGCSWLLSVGGAAIILNWSINAANFAGHSKRMTVSTINFICYYGGNIIGPFLFKSSEAPRYPTAVKAVLALMSTSIIATGFIGLWMLLENRRRDAEGGVDETDGTLEGFTDHTDRENRAFRYRF
jgi:Major Facilitator Superfamily